VQFLTECPTDFPTEAKCQFGVLKEGFWVSLATGRAIPGRPTSWPSHGSLHRISAP
jgi:hypothetical protein